MSNLYFEFKKFKVYHDQCAMKVGTDGVLLGVWTNVSDVRAILDVGTGSGLIAMMLAQRVSNDVSVDGIDVDLGAVNQSLSNVIQSGFNNIHITQSSIQKYAILTEKKYDLIVSNPPFFTASLHSPDKQRSIARHTDSLSMIELIECSEKLLADKGKLSVIYPFEYKQALVSLAEKYRFNVSHITNVLPTATSKPKRILIELTKQDVILNEDDLVLELKRHVYSKEFIELAKDFYLKL